MAASVMAAQERAEATAAIRVSASRERSREKPPVVITEVAVVTLTGDEPL
jgi:hypothetical protein